MGINIAIDSEEYNLSIENIYAEVFGPGRFAKAASVLRENNKCLYEISRLAFKDNELIGGCRMWPISFEGGADAIFLGPIAIKPEYRKFGIGRKLLEAVITANKNSENQNIILVGDFPFFGRFGFEKIPNGLIKMPLPVDANRLLWLKNSETTGISGAVFAPL